MSDHSLNLRQPFQPRVVGKVQGVTTEEIMVPWVGSSAELIAKVVEDMKKGRIFIDTSNPDSELVKLNVDTHNLAQWADVVDVTPVWQQFMSKPEGSMLYEDHRICPPWDNSLLCYVNGYGNVCVLSCRALDITREDHIEGSLLNKMMGQWERWDSLADTHTIDWDRVRWVLHVAIYMGGRGGGEPVMTQGPLHCFRIAVYPDGEIADLNWIQLREDLDVSMWDSAMTVLLDTFNLCNCVNVEVVEPTRPRPERKRLSRRGVTVSEIHVRPTSRSYRGKGTPLSQFSSSPLSSVRGHFAEYGPKYGKGLLFGHIEGRFWIPQHIRGSEIYGVSEQEYVAEP